MSYALLMKRAIIRGEVFLASIIKFLYNIALGLSLCIKNISIMNVSVEEYLEFKNI